MRCGGPIDGMARLNPKYTLERIERIKFTSFIAFFKLHFLRLGMPFAQKICVTLRAKYVIALGESLVVFSLDLTTF